MIKQHGFKHKMFGENIPIASSVVSELRFDAGEVGQQLSHELDGPRDPKPADRS